MKKLLFSLFFVFVLVSNIFAQQATLVWSLNPPEKGANLTCPNQRVFYNANPSSASLNTNDCQFRWEVTGGYFPDLNNATSTTLEPHRNITVIWNNTSATGTLKLFVERCAAVETNFNKPFQYYIRTISTETPTANGTYPLQVEKGVRTVTFNVARVKIPNTGVQGFETPYYADEYEWSLPANRPNWYFEGFGISKRNHITSGTSVRVVVDALNAGSVSVRGVVSACVPNNFSKPLALPIIRITPSIGAIRTASTNNSITADGKIACATRDTITVTTTLPQGLTARHYKWRFSAAQAGWKFINPNTGALQDTLTTFAPTTKAITTPNTEPTIGVLANINYGNNVFENSNESFLAIKLNRIQAKIISATAAQPDLCVGEISGTTIRTLGQDATDFRYENLTPRTISIPANQTGNSCRVTTLMAGVGQVKVTAINACGDGESQIVQIGVFEGVPFNSGVFNQQKAPYCPNQVHGVTIETVENTISYEWVALSRDINVSGFGTQGYIIPRREGIHQFAVITANPCASDTTIYQIYANYSNCGFQPWQNQLVIYPNPAKDVLNIALPTESSATAIFRLIDGFGQIRKETTAATQNNNTVTFSVADLPQGIYYLHVIDHDFTKQYQIAITK
jgi:hypothetical protein